MNSPQLIPIQEISLDGFQLVRGEMFRGSNGRYEATCTIWHDSLAFSKLSVETLNNCERVLLKVNSQERRILVIPCTTKDPDGIRWIKTVKEASPRKMDCRAFTERLYETWGWDRELVYRSTGRLVTADKKVMLLFDFGNPESWKYKKKEG